MKTTEAFIKDGLEESQLILQKISLTDEYVDFCLKASSLITNSLKNSGKVLACGNGGSMCDAMHFSEELTGRFKKDRRPLAAMALADSAHISCVSNDFGYEHIFSRSVEALGLSQDILLAISTSGNSLNIINAVKSAKNRDMKVIALLGKTGGELAGIVDLSYVVPSNSTERIQEIHIKTIHFIIEGIERVLFPELYSIKA